MEEVMEEVMEEERKVRRVKCLANRNTQTLLVIDTLTLVDPKWSPSLTSSSRSARRLLLDLL